MHSLLTEVLHLGFQNFPLTFEICFLRHFLLLLSFYRFHWTIIGAFETLEIDRLLLDGNGLELSLCRPLLLAVSFCLDRLKVHTRCISRASTAAL